MNELTNKYKIINNQWIWNTTDYSLDELLFIGDESSTDLDTLKARGEYLVNVIDKIPHKLTSEDIANLPINERLIIPYGPSSGKTSAIRQYLVSRVPDYFLYSTRLVKDVNEFYYDLVANFYYNNKVLPNKFLINKYTSDHKLSVSDCRKTHILITTHERMYIDPPGNLYITEVNCLTSPSSPVGIPNTRTRVFIDEYIKMYSDISVDLVKYRCIIDNINYIVSTSSEASSFSSRSAVRSQIIYYIMHPEKLPMQSLGSSNNMIKILSRSLNLVNSKDQESKLKFNKDDIRSSNRFIFFMNLVCEEMYTNTISDETESLSVKYNLPTFINGLYILDGTGDILFNTSKLYKIYNPDKFTRSISLIRPPKRINNSSFDRVINSVGDITNIDTTIKTHFINPIESILDNIDGKLLVYTWKSLKLDNKLMNKVFNSDNDSLSMRLESVVSDLPKYIHDNISSEYSDRVRIITYQSGKERVTSDYTDCDSIFILGRFMLPKSVIGSMNELTKSTMSVNDYTVSLIIQAIYRTSARKNKSINLFFSDDYSEEFVSLVLSNFKKVNIINDFSRSDKLDIELSKLKYSTRNKKYYDFIIDNKDNILNDKPIELPDNERGDKFKPGLSKLLNNSNSNLKLVDHTDTSGKSIRSVIKLEFLSNE